MRIELLGPNGEILEAFAFHMPPDPVPFTLRQHRMILFRLGNPGKQHVVFVGVN